MVLLCFVARISHFTFHAMSLMLFDRFNCDSPSSDCLTSVLMGVLHDSRRCRSVMVVYVCEWREGWGEMLIHAGKFLIQRSPNNNIYFRHKQARCSVVYINFLSTGFTIRFMSLECTVMRSQALASRVVSMPSRFTIAQFLLLNMSTESQSFVREVDRKGLACVLWVCARMI